MATRKPTSTGRGGTRGATSKKTAGKARKSAASASRKLETASASRGAAKTAMKAATAKKAASVTARSAQRRDVAKALTGTPKTATRKTAEQKLTRKMMNNGIGANRGAESRGMAREHYGNDVAKPAIKKTASAATGAVRKATGAKVTNTSRAVRKPKPATATQSAAKKTLTSTAVRKKKPLY